MNSKLMGGMLLVAGTTIGAGMLALPIITSQLGFGCSVALLIFFWGVMTASAFLLLEVNLWLPLKSNLISMARTTLGPLGQAIAWVTYLLFLYSILAAYISGGGDLLHYLLQCIHLPLSITGAIILFTMVLGAIVYFGIRAVDYVNRGLMSVKMGSYVLLVLALLPFISGLNLIQQDWTHFPINTGMTISIVSFCCGMIVPTLRAYFGQDIRSLCYALLFGTLIPLICYITWNLVIMGLIPLRGEHGLIALSSAQNANSDLLHRLSVLVPSMLVQSLAQCFISVCMTTSFLSVSLCLSDFLSDGLHIDKQGIGHFVVLSITFLPPLLVVLLFPDAFLRCLRYSGIDCIILMILLPVAMVWRGRYRHKLSTSAFKVCGGKTLLIFLALFSILLLGESVLKGVGM